MIITQVIFQLDEPISLEAASEIFNSTAPKYRGKAGLNHKYYIRSDDGMRVGGLYFWENRDFADATYSKEWRKMVTDKYGAIPIISYFDAPVSVHNT